MVRLLLLTLCVAGCGSEAKPHTATLNTPSCDYSPLGEDQYAFCQEYSGTVDVIAPYKSACSTAKATWADTGCHGEYIGGCRSTNMNPTITITNWFTAESGYTKSTLMQACPATQSTFVAP